MKSMFFAVAALAGVVAMPATAAVVTVSLDATLMTPFSLNTVAIDPVSLGLGDSLDLTINFTNGPMVVGNNSSLWIGLLTDGDGATLTTTATMFILGGSANMVASVSGTQNNSFVHVGNYFGGSQVQTAPGTMSFAGLRQTLTIDDSDLQGTRQFNRAFFYFDQLATGVPEPQSWAMLIAGFGMVGASARRRRHAAA